jgi:L-2-hydroxyglutarate oxidase LhgO
MGSDRGLHGNENDHVPGRRRTVLIMDYVETIVIGAGVVGLAIGRRLALAGHEVVVVESARAIGTETSSRNSEVIHAGIYYPPGSLKSRLCVAGKRKLYDYAAARHFDARPVGKLIVATTLEEIGALDAIADRARANGVKDLTPLTCDEASQLEPEIQCLGALWSPNTGIVDSHAFMLALQGDLEDAGGLIAFGSRVTGIDLDADGAEVTISSEESYTLRCKNLINSAGLAAPAVADLMAGGGSIAAPKAYYCKGTYYTLARRSPFTHLIYPVPSDAGLGIHATLDMSGQVRFGPDTVWIDAPNYVPDDRFEDQFYAAIRRYWPGLSDGALSASYAGVRPKIVGPGASAADFRIDGPDTHGQPGLVNLFGIESPGLTASLAIAGHVTELLGVSSHLESEGAMQWNVPA